MEELTHYGTGDNVGRDKNITNNYYNCAQYQDLKKQWDKLQERYDKTQQKSLRYPGDADFKVELLQIDSERNEVQKKIDDLKREVFRLNEIFTKIDINTERLKLARQHFDESDFPAARAILNAEEMGNELNALLKQKDQLQQQQNENQENLINNSNEFLVLAQLTAINLTLADDRLEKTVEYFEQSLKAAHTIENTTTYALFLKKNNRIDKAYAYFEEAVLISRRDLVKNPSEGNLKILWATLTNLVDIQKDNNPGAAKKNCREALQIARDIAMNPSEDNLSSLWRTLMILGNIQRVNNPEEAEKNYEEAFQILLDQPPDIQKIYSGDIGLLLYSIGPLIRHYKRDFRRAEKTYKKALAIFRQQALSDKETYQPFIPAVLYNMAVLYEGEEHFKAADKAYEQTLSIRRKLAKANPDFLPDVGLTLMNYSVSLLEREKRDFSKAEKMLREALGIYRDLEGFNPGVHLQNVAAVLCNLANLRSARRTEKRLPLHKISSDIAETEKILFEALNIYRSLADINLQISLLGEARTSVYLGLFYLNEVKNKDKSLTYAKEALVSTRHPLLEFNTSANKYCSSALNIVEDWGLDTNEFLNQANRVAEGDKE